MENKEIMVKWAPFKNLIKCVGYQMPDGWWYVHTPFDDEWHFIPKEDVFKMENGISRKESERYGKE